MAHSSNPSGAAGAVAFPTLSPNFAPFAAAIQNTFGGATLPGMPVGAGSGSGATYTPSQPPAGGISRRGRRNTRRRRSSRRRARK